MDSENDGMRLNIGCGGRRIEGYTGIDAVARPAADIVAPADSVPLPDGCADEILAIHIFEHFYRWQVDGVLVEWKRLLAPGGRLVMEMPDLMKACRNVLSGTVQGGKDPDQLTLWALYGDPRQADPYMSHRWAWSPKSLRALLQAHNFDQIGDEPPQFHPAGRVHRDMRVVARKPL